MRLYITMKQSALTDVIIYHYIKKYATKHKHSESTRSYGLQGYIFSTNDTL